MIRYALVCEAAHEFDAWFRDSAAFDAQAADAAIQCPICRSASVAKAVMAPFVARSGGPRAGQTPPPTGAEPDGDAKLDPSDDAVAARMRAKMRGLRAAILAATEDVGERFPVEARRMRDGEAKSRPIRGAVELEEAKKLLEEDIDVWLLPGDGH